METFKPLISWLHLHPHWGGFITFLFAFAESIAIIGLIVPGSVIMAAIGILIGAGVLPLGSTVIWGIAGALLGDLLSYWFGYYYQETLRSIWPFRLFPTWLDRGEKFFQQHGGKSILIGRFIGPIRPILPIIAGALNMNFWRFLAVDIIAATAWAPLYMLPGWIIGAASLALPPDAATRIISYLVIILIFIWLCYWLLKKILLISIVFLDNNFQKLWNYLLANKKPCWFCRLIQSAHIPEDHSQLTLLICFVISTILFLILFINVLTHTGITHLNIPVHAFFSSLYTLSLEKIMLIITYLGKPSSIFALWLVILFWLCWRRYFYVAIHWLLLGLTITASTFLAKHIAAYPRPLGLKKTPTGGSFPSGHTALSMTIFGFLAVLITRDRSTYVRWITYSTISLLIFLIACSRLVLGAHWLTDVIGGLLLGLSLVFLFALAYRRRHIQLPHLSELIIITFVSISSLWSINIYTHFKNDVENFKPHWPVTYLDQEQWWQQGVNNTIPLFRSNRLGKKVQTMNIEFYGDIDQLKQHLIKQGWIEKPHSRILETLHYLGTKNHQQTLPLFKKVYHSQASRLELGKSIDSNKQFLILQMWESHIILLPDNNILWVGTLNFRLPTTYLGLVNLAKTKSSTDHLAPLDVFLSYVKKNYQYKFLTYNTPKLNEHEDIDWKQQVLLLLQYQDR